MTITIDVEAVEVLPDILHTLRLQKASHLVESASRWSLAAGVIPIPFLDAATLASIQTKLLIDLSELYGVKVTKELASSVISVLLGTLIPVGVAKLAIGSTAKLLPGVGTLVGAVSMSAMGSVTTNVIGRVFVRHFENGGTLVRFSESNLKAEFRHEFMKQRSKG